LSNNISLTKIDAKLRRVSLAIILITLGLLFYYVWHLSVPDYIVTIILFFLSEIYVSIIEQKAQLRAAAIEQDAKNSVPRFIANFCAFCQESIKAIKLSENNSEILTIQTPLNPSETAPGKASFSEYLKSIVNELLTKNNDSNSSKVSVFKRLIVINNSNDASEIAQEKEKIVQFIELIYDKLTNWTNPWKPDLSNISIGLVEAGKIASSPFSHLDILLIKNSHLVIAFSKEDGNGYSWGTSIHFNKNKFNDNFSEQIPIFAAIYNNVWDTKDMSNKSCLVHKIEFSQLHDPNNIGFSKTTVLKQVETVFSSIISPNKPVVTP
jgi:hypothetical protein